MMTFYKEKTASEFPTMLKVKAKAVTSIALLRLGDNA